MWKSTERKKVIAPPAASGRLGLWATGAAFLLILTGWLGFASGEGGLATIARYAFFLLAALTVIAFIAGRRR